jgi:hypothetical protein
MAIYMSGQLHTGGVLQNMSITPSRSATENPVGLLPMVARGGGLIWQYTCQQANSKLEASRRTRQSRLRPAQQKVLDLLPIANPDRSWHSLLEHPLS